MSTGTATQNFVPVRDIKDDVVVLKDGKLCMILLASSINFALKSTEEQEAILHQFQTFLNTIDFSMQIYVQSRRLDISPYLALLKEREDKQDNDLMRIQLREYMEFINTFMKEVDVMSKNFFVVVPYSPAPVDIKSDLTSFFKPGKSDTHTDDRFAEHRVQLEQRITVVEQGLNRIGVRTAALKNEELVELFYHIFNPTDVNAQIPEHKE